MRVAQTQNSPYEKLGNLAQAAFNPSLNVELRLQASIKLAVAYNVSDSNIIHNVDELDLFMFQYSSVKDNRRLG
ncbi:hypothetical protein [Nostoc sphaeroides]|uniref:Uncharacterized protein n=1 Tax=Nostoc sphaeroides CCNUC1 TaxID=2653204 RepID=A0A5P8WAG2_9NOSO|nr:hypothetical protein [Nostoc sphaeroides]MCC5627129.1 hypothetical protein [Nostoc sphaeroides CHAB 2801]QFS48889.1 hypothetical protein GXM_06383 [Nostoc sphaeroides CCNUC1]